MKTLWVIQNNLGALDDVERIKEVAERIGAEAIGIPVIPFTNDLPDVPTDRPVIFYGSARWTTNISKSNKWTPGVFHSDVALSAMAYKNYWNMRYINHDAVCTVIGNVQKLPYADDDYIFIRPNLDDKSFAGTVMTFKETCDWASKLYGMNDINESTSVIVAPAKTIVDEYRCFVHDQGFITASQYRRNGRLHQSADIPEEVRKFAWDAYNIYHPLPIMAIDVGIDGDGDLKVIEAGSVHSTGFYKSNIAAFVKVLTWQAERAWASK